jgi:hypothetical protein
MKNNLLNVTVFVVLAGGLAGCSTPPAAEKAEPIFVSAPLAPPIYKLPDDGRFPHAPLVFGRLCQLGTSCLSLDPRPFEPCLLSTKPCTDKAVEPLLVAPPTEQIPPPWVQSTRFGKTDF